VPPDIEAPGPEADAIRAQVGHEAYELNVQQFCCAGLNFGYFYQGSPIIAAGDETPPPYTMGGFTPSTVPGCRVPHVWLDDGQSLYDRFGPGYTLLRLDPMVDVAPLQSACRQAGVPLALVDLDRGRLPDTYRHNLLLCRTDQHVAWRGNRLPVPLHGLLAMMRGAA
jgi:hypothetical protein